MTDTKKPATPAVSNGVKPRQINATLYRKHGWALLSACALPNGDEAEWWIGPKGQLSFCQIFFGNNGVSNYFAVEENTWEDLEKKLSGGHLKSVATDATLPQSARTTNGEPSL